MLSVGLWEWWSENLCETVHLWKQWNARKNCQNKLFKNLEISQMFATIYIYSTKIVELGKKNRVCSIFILTCFNLPFSNYVIALNHSSYENQQACSHWRRQLVRNSSQSSTPRRYHNVTCLPTPWKNSIHRALLLFDPGKEGRAYFQSSHIILFKMFSFQQKFWDMQRNSKGIPYTGMKNAVNNRWYPEGIQMLNLADKDFKSTIMIRIK